MNWISTQEQQPGGVAPSGIYIVWLDGAWTKAWFKKDIWTNNRNNQIYPTHWLDIKEPDGGYFASTLKEKK